MECGTDNLVCVAVASGDASSTDRFVCATLHTLPPLRGYWAVTVPAPSGTAPSASALQKAVLVSPLKN
ncbi:MAG: hypothetical protein LBT53_01360 [Puniceicoccales bacterium]|nr:hypothetical protein [Puniceicoccales bacterium]